jgi:hypothetical protein
MKFRRILNIRISKNNMLYYKFILKKIDNLKLEIITKVLLTYR